MKYIDADRFLAEIRKRLKNTRDYMNGSGMKYKGPKYFRAQGKESAYDALFSVITSLQQEQPEQIEEYGPYARQYPKSKVSQEQSEVDFEKEFQEYWYLHQYDQRLKRRVVDGHGKAVLKNIARHFYELGKARKEE